MADKQRGPGESGASWAERRQGLAGIVGWGGPGAEPGGIGGKADTLTDRQTDKTTEK